MNKLADSELAATTGGAGLDGDNLPPSYFRPLSNDAYIASILALLQPRWVMHVSD